MSGQLGKQFWTYTLSVDTLKITSDFGLTALSICLQSGTGSIQGTESVNGLASKQIDLVIGQPVLISTDSLTVINNLTIFTNGVVNLIGR
jgi:hypothetical protein